ncbi:hypothetical protein BG000_001721 [Podila horticola]|nr:hypothetical protein BG000_001721 [Podila horticola]
MVVTEKADDLGRKPLAIDTPSTAQGDDLKARSENGGSGKGVICGIIARSAGVFENAKKVCDCSGTTLWEEARLMNGNDFY